VATDATPDARLMSCYWSRKPSRVVIVDDDPAVCAALAFALELEGFEVEGLASGEALLRHTLPLLDACLVVDERLPGLSGLDALLQLRARHVTLPALLMTSHPNFALRAAAQAAGVPILEKPLLGDVLSNAIRAALRP
jgi:FixJ family two-component response regulator